jgi:superfamily II DNA or RNA helicase
MGDGYCTYGPIISATAQTLIGFRARRHGKSIIGANLKMREVVRKYEVMFYDECHHASSSTWFEIGMQSGAFRRYGLSGTPLRAKQLNDMQLIGVTGPLIYSVEATDLIAANLAARPKIVVVVADGSSEPELPWEFGEKVTASGARISVKLPVPYPEAYRRCVVCSVPHNNAVVLATSWLVDHKRRVLVLCRQKEHFLRLGSLLEKAGVNHIALWGATDMADRLRAKEALNAGRIQVILSTVIFDEGEDLPQVNAIVLAEGVQSDVNSVQRVGRGMRPKSVADAGDVWVVDIVPTGHTILLRHGLRRVRAWEKEGYPVRLVDEWPSDGRTFDYDSLLPFLTWDHAG